MIDILVYTFVYVLGQT